MTETNVKEKMQKIYEDQYKAFNAKVAEVNKLVTQKTFTPDDEGLPTPMEFLEEGMKKFIEEDTATSSTMTKTKAEIKMQKIYEDQYKAFNAKVAEVNKLVTQKTFTRAEHDLPTPMEFLEEGMKQFLEEDTATSSKTKTNTWEDHK